MIPIEQLIVKEPLSVPFDFESCGVCGTLVVGDFMCRECYHRVDPVQFPIINN